MGVELDLLDLFGKGLLQSFNRFCPNRLHGGTLSMDGRIFHIIEKIRENWNHDWTVEEMAIIIELSESHFQKLFKSETGMSPKAYLKNLRLEKARELLENGFKQIKQIGYEIGLTNDSHFARDFKKKYGTTPTQYRKNSWALNRSNSVYW
ncbi:MAG TPA: AraC family transcriptional regulator [Pyrinomonadaceae bacterium]|nr:AraC family transcriptional regulator [Pyrinomonadaceae bacterium]HMP64438.1 AraC family transcriptional regulator [Pyrinomonadaceae bacterium]